MGEVGAFTRLKQVFWSVVVAGTEAAAQLLEVWTASGVLLKKKMPTLAAFATPEPPDLEPPLHP